jgi:hypothetical protein
MRGQALWDKAGLERAAPKRRPLASQQVVS